MNTKLQKISSHRIISVPHFKSSFDWLQGHVLFSCVLSFKLNHILVNGLFTSWIHCQTDCLINIWPYSPCFIPFFMKFLLSTKCRAVRISKKRHYIRQNVYSKTIIFTRIITNTRKSMICHKQSRRLCCRLEAQPLQVRHKQECGRGFILLLPQAAALPRFDSGSDVVKPASRFVIQNRQTSCSMWFLMYGTRY